METNEIRTTDTTRTKVNNLQEAIEGGYNFCSERKTLQLIFDMHGVDRSLIVPDPPSLGGDGQPGFNCPNCNARSRIFEYMRPVHSDKSLYCNAAFVSWEDLQALQKSGDHCDKTRVGEPLVQRNFGIPIHNGEGVKEALIPLFHQMKNKGLLVKELRAAEPEHQCPVTAGEEGQSLNVEQLTGIWMITFAFALVALVVKFVQCCLARREASLSRSGTTTMTRLLQRYDQWGEPTDKEVFLDGKLYDPYEVKRAHHRAQSTARMMTRTVRPQSCGNAAEAVEDDDNFDVNPTVE